MGQGEQQPADQAEKTQTAAKTRPWAGRCHEWLTWLRRWNDWLKSKYEPWDFPLKLLNWVIILGVAGYLLFAVALADKNQLVLVLDRPVVYAHITDDPDSEGCWSPTEGDIVHTQLFNGNNVRAPDVSGEVIRFDEVILDQKGSVSKGKDWTYTAPSTGLYNVVVRISPGLDGSDVIYDPSVHKDSPQPKPKPADPKKCNEGTAVEGNYVIKIHYRPKNDKVDKGRRFTIGSAERPKDAKWGQSVIGVTSILLQTGDKISVELVLRTVPNIRMMRDREGSFISITKVANCKPETSDCSRTEQEIRVDEFMGYLSSKVHPD